MTDTRDTLRPQEMHTNKVELIGFYGSDETHALSAWTSTSRVLTDEKRARLPQFLMTLAQEGHTSVFEKSMLHFLCNIDLATQIQLLKHRIGVSVNGESARYKELKEDKFYVPSDWDDHDANEYLIYAEDAFRRYHECIERLVSKGVARKRAKESARFYLPYGMQYTMDVSFNFRSFNHFIKLRYSLHAQKEIRDVAFQMLRAVQETKCFDATLRAFDLVDSFGNIRSPF